MRHGPGLHHAVEGDDAVGAGGELLEQRLGEVAAAPIAQLSGDGGIALGPAEMRLELRLAEPALILRRHRLDHRHHPLGGKVVDELRLQLAEPRRMQQAVQSRLLSSSMSEPATWIASRRGNHHT